MFKFIVTYISWVEKQSKLNRTNILISYNYIAMEKLDYFTI